MPIEGIVKREYIEKLMQKSIENASAIATPLNSRLEELGRLSNDLTTIDELTRHYDILLNKRVETDEVREFLNSHRKELEQIVRDKKPSQEELHRLRVPLEEVSHFIEVLQNCRLYFTSPQEVKPQHLREILMAAGKIGAVREDYIPIGNVPFDKLKVGKSYSQLSTEHQSAFAHDVRCIDADDGTRLNRRDLERLFLVQVYVKESDAELALRNYKLPYDIATAATRLELSGMNVLFYVDSHYFPPDFLSILNLSDNNLARVGLLAKPFVEFAGPFADFDKIRGTLVGQDVFDSICEPYRREIIRYGVKIPFKEQTIFSMFDNVSRKEKINQVEIFDISFRGIFTKFNTFQAIRFFENEILYTALESYVQTFLNKYSPSK